jgi:hypothetical protein
MQLPSSLSRKAIIRTFDVHSAVSWEKLFEREEKNGLSKLRVDGDYPGWVYYETEGLIKWLIRNDHYSINEIRAMFGHTVQRSNVRTHVLAG